MLGTLGVITVTLAAAAIAAYAQYMYKKGLREFRFIKNELVSVFRDRHILLGGVLYLVSLAVYLYALNSTPIISFVYPVFASAFIFVHLISKHVLKEMSGHRRLAGTLLIVIGIAVISLTL